MSDDKYDFSESETSHRFLDQSAYKTTDGRSEVRPGLRYSSPWPWIRALMIGAALWAGIIWLAWKLW